MMLTPLCRCSSDVERGLRMRDLEINQQSRALLVAPFGDGIANVVRRALADQIVQPAAIDVA